MNIFNLITPVSCEEDHIYMGNGGQSIALQISLFTDIDVGNVRTTVINGIPYLCYNDICNSLGSKNHTDQIIPKLDREYEIAKAYGYQDELPYIYINLIQKLGYGATRSYPYLFISESSFYNILESSRTEKAVLFRRWINHEVLPNLRVACQTQDNVNATLDELVIGKKLAELNDKFDEFGYNLRNENVSLHRQNSSLMTENQYQSALIGALQYEKGAMVNKMGTAINNVSNNINSMNKSVNSAMKSYDYEI